MIAVRVMDGRGRRLRHIARLGTGAIDIRVIARLTKVKKRRTDQWWICQAPDAGELLGSLCPGGNRRESRRAEQPDCVSMSPSRARRQKVSTRANPAKLPWSVPGAAGYCGVVIKVRATSRSTTAVSDMHAWTRAENFDDWSLICCQKPHLDLLTDPAEFLLTHRLSRIGPIALAEFVVDGDMSMDRTDLCDAFRVSMLVAGHIEGVHKGESVRPGPGDIAVAAPGGITEARWAAGARIVTLLMDRGVVDDALSDVLGRQVTSRVDYTPVMTTTLAPTRNWIKMLALLSQQLFAPDSLLNHPLVGLPFADSLVRGFLLAADHSLRDALASGEALAAPRAIRAAIEIIEEEAHLPLTLSSIASRSCVSVRSLQLGFQQYLHTSPMAYLREVRLRRARRTLMESDPSMTTVTSVAHRWGFNHVGRFAAAYAGRYHEMPAETLRRSLFQRNVPRRPHAC